MTYLISQIALSLAAALLAGLILGWFVWGRRLTSRPEDLDRIRELEADLVTLEAELESLREPDVGTPVPIIRPSAALFQE
ncbi:hypothetical protein [Rubrivirga sp.]|uniref:hypothetical protein n=1 Tax=Rubrivirga sp. TaxID=1885344 RepID=UPI003C735575